MIDDLELLRLIENNARLSSEEIAVMLGTTAADVEAEIKRLKDEVCCGGKNAFHSCDLLSNECSDIS